ncbi:hypothetical protein BGZ60DRAFT_438065 [Tricladium varicosporioides]|nr:hypothetical protein BGZ60DRAFT_438065 [Hymenoscyphus varicosporioides]
MMNLLSRFGQSRPRTQQTLPDEEIDFHLGRLCSLPAGQHIEGQRIPEQNIRDMQLYLEWLDYKSQRSQDRRWLLRPRLYGILRNIGALEYMDTFIEQDMNDFYLPYNEPSLPLFVGMKEGVNLRQRFFDAQEYYLTNMKEIEKDTSSHKHFMLQGSGDIYFVPVKPLGHGSFGRLSTRQYARKRVLRGRDSEKNRQAQRFLIDELRALKSLDHKHLVNIIGSYSDKEYIAYLMNPVAEGTLEQFLASSQPLRTDHQVMLRQFYGCLAGAVHHLHKSHIRHRDLTARNILIYRGEVYISDFGSAYSWAHKPSSMTRHRSTPVSPDYMAPEVSKDEERGSPSDMWSLGVVFLEMTTKLLGLRVDRLKSTIEAHAQRAKVLPYAYANIPAVVDWLTKLSEQDVQFRHDKEPLIWVRGLLQSKPDNRPSSQILMKDILETPSFGIFCCFKCQPDFQDDAFAYDAAMSKADPEEDSQKTRDMVASIFETGGPPGHLRGMSSGRTDSVQNWLNDYGNDFRHSNSRTNPPASDSADEPYEDAMEYFGNLGTEELLYGAYEHEFYNNVEISFDHSQFHPVGESPASGSPLEPVEMPGDNTWIMEGSSEVEGIVTFETNHKDICDTGLGFMEYESCSSDGEKTQPLFEEISDRSDTSSEGENLPTISAQLEILLAEDEEGSNSGNVDDQSQEKLFDEISDSSDVSDNAQVQGTGEAREIKKGADAVPDTVLEYGNNTGSTQIQDLPLGNSIEVVNGSIPAPNTPIQCKEGEPATMEDRVLNNDQLLPILSDTPIRQDNSKPQEQGPKIPKQDPTLQGTEKPPRPEIRRLEIENGSTPTSTSNYAVETPGLVAPILATVESQESPIKMEEKETAKITLQPFLEPIRDKMTVSPVGENQESSVVAGAGTQNIPKNKGNVTFTKDTPPVPPKTTHKGNREKKKVGFADKQSSGQQATQPDTDKHQSKVVPSIVVDAAEEVPIPLSKENIKKANEASKPPRSLRQREALLSVNPGKFLKDTWEKASSAPTSEMSEKSKSILSRFLVFIPSDAEFEYLLTTHCKKGSSSKVRYLLTNDSRTKAKTRRLRIPLLRAVEGGTSRHTKCVRELIAAGADVNIKCKRTGKTPLHIAVEHPYFKGYINLIGLLISEGADTNACDSNGDYPLMKLFFGSDSLPLEEHRREALALLLWKDTNLNITQLGTGNTPLHLAVRRQDKYPVAMLLSKGANVNAKNSSGNTPLQMTANQFRGELSSDHAQVLDLLLHYDARVDEKAGALKRTPLHWAANSGTAQAVDMLLKYKASPTLEDGKGHSAIALAIMNAGKLTTDAINSESNKIDDHIEIMQRLNDVTNCGWPMKTGKCVLEIACKDTDTTLLRDMLAKGLDPTARYGDTTVREFAKKYGSPEAAALLSRVKE